MLHGMLIGSSESENAELNKVKQTCAARLLGAFKWLASTKKWGI